MGKRECKLQVCTGMVGVGKTHQTLKEVVAYIKGNPELSRRPRKALMYDPNNKDYTIYDSLYFDVDEQNDFKKSEYIRKFSDLDLAIGKRILAVDKYLNEMTQEQKREAFRIIMTFAKNCLVVLEDMNGYYTNFDSDFVVGRLTTYRHRNTDLIIHLQSVGALRPRLWQATKILRMHYEMDDVSRMRESLQGRYKIVKIAQLIVNEQYLSGDHRFFVYVDLEKQQISGNFSGKDFIKASNIFINQHRKECLDSIVYSFTAKPQFQHYEKARYQWIKDNMRLVPESKRVEEHLIKAA